jgi:hypothetical protein
VPSADAILTGLTAIANDWRGLATGWHVWLAVVGLAVAGGWRPSVQTAGVLLAAPLASVALLGWAYGNPFNGLAVATLTVVLMTAAIRASSTPIQFDSLAWLARGGALIIFGATYPHFVAADSPTAYVTAAPFGLLPCPTLSVVIGATLVLSNLDMRPWSMALLVAGSLYGMIGVFRLDVQLDWGLLVGTAMLGAKLASGTVLWRSVHADHAERVCRLPGDDVIPTPLASLTHAVTIDRDSRSVWPWLAQMGAGRAGWYSYDLLDNGRQPSATRIMAEQQSIAIGTLFPALPGATDGFKVLAFEPGTWLLLGWAEPDGAPLVTWAFVLESRGNNRTRLITRVRGSERYRFHGLPAALSTKIVRIVHFVMQRRQLLGIARRVESLDDTLTRSVAAMPEAGTFHA